MKLTYWIAENERDHRCYSIRAKTKKAVMEELAQAWNPTHYSKPRKVTVEYLDGFDLVMQCLDGEGAGDFER